MTLPAKWIHSAVLGATLLLAPQAMAQADTAGQTSAQTMMSQPAGSGRTMTGFWLTTPHPAFSVGAGETATLSLDLTNANMPPQRADLAVSGLPDSWDYTLQGGGRDVSAVMVRTDKTQSVDLTITPPKDAQEQSYDFEVSARTPDETSTLPMSVTVAEVQGGGVTLQPEIPGLSGTVDSTFSYSIDVNNNSTSDGLFNLSADVPEGFSTTFKRGYGDEEITGVRVAAGESETITFEVQPNSSVEAGEYPIGFEVRSGDMGASTELSATVSGQPSLRLVGPQQRLSGTATAGEAKTFPFTLQNTGTEAAQQVTLNGRAPQGWEVSFEPSEIAQLPAGSSQDVTVSITPAKQAVAGDYMTNLSASAGSAASENAEFRVTVETSTMWGLVGLLVIAVAVVVLVLAVLRYGRR